MTLDEISVKVLSSLEKAVGSSDWWTSTQIKEWTNDLYKEIASITGVIKKRTTDTVSVAEQADYEPDVPAGYDNVIGILAATYDGKDLEEKDVELLDETFHKWREDTSGTPQYWYFEDGNFPTTVSLYKVPSTADLEIGITLILIPSTMIDGGSPLAPFEDGLLLIDGVCSVALQVAGGGRDLDMADYFWGKFQEKLNIIIKGQKQKRRYRRLRMSGEGSGPVGPSFGSNYPSNLFGEDY